MTIELYPPLAIHELGQRENNEDYLYPTFSDKETRLTSRFFIVCDGVGGGAKGEEASRLVCQTFADFFKNKEIVSEVEVDQAVHFAELAMDNFILYKPDASGMGTTLTFLFIDEEGVLIAHIGDSRIYHIRKGQVIYKTADHSLVNELVSQGMITPEQAATHPKRNIVTRALMGSQRPAQADAYRIKDICTDDFFFLCTDGILESITDESLTSILGNNHKTDAQKIAEIQKNCAEKSRDNYSAYLLRVKSIEASSFATSLDGGNAESISSSSPLVEQPAVVSPSKREASRNQRVGLILAFLAFISVCTLVWLQNSKELEDEKISESNVSQNKPKVAKPEYPSNTGNTVLILPDTNNKTYKSNDSALIITSTPINKEKNVSPPLETHKKVVKPTVIPKPQHPKTNSVDNVKKQPEVPKDTVKITKDTVINLKDSLIPEY